MTLEFVSTDETTQAHSKFCDFLAQSDDGVQMAFAYLSKAGWSLLEGQQSSLAHDMSFLVVSVDFPTDLDVLAEVARNYPDKVYLHLGWVTPYEKKVGAALMHSKLAVGRGSGGWRLWVGSQNMTARAMVSGNMEAALLYESGQRDQPICDAEQHLRRCKNGAETFDLSKLDEYKQIQASKAFGIGIKGKLLVLYAEEVWPIVSFPALVVVRIPTAYYDGLTNTGTEAHLIVLPVGKLGKSPFLPPGAKRYTGVVIEDNRTQFHRSGGSASTMPQATHWLEMASIPTLVVPDSTNSKPWKQVAIKIDEQPGRQQPVSADEFLYSVTATRVKAEAAATRGRTSRHEVPRNMLQFYSRDSQNAGELLFAPRAHLTEVGQVTIFAGTPIPRKFKAVLERSRNALPREIERDRHTERRVEVRLTERQTDGDVDPFFFRSEFRLRTDDETLE